MMNSSLRAVSAAVLLASASLAAQAAPSFVNGLALDGAALDLSGGSSVNNGRLGYFSDIYYDSNRNEWWGLSDRGPGGGTLNYNTRVQRFTLDVDFNTGAISNFKIAETVVFQSAGQGLNGLAPNPKNQLGLAFDPEGVVINPRTGTFLISDEYGPSVREFSRSGELIRTFNTPANLVPRNAATGVANYADDTGNTAGKRTNRGFEGLAISPDGKYAYAMLQSAMLDEGGGNGSVNRIVKFDISTGDAVAQYAYQMKRSGQGQGISALVAINDHEFYVLERNNRGVGVGAEFATADKEVYRIDLSGATDVSGLNLSTGSYTKVSKSGQILDLDANTLAELGGKSPEKWEGLAIGPKLANGNYLILAGTDNDYSVTQNAGGEQFDVYFRFADANPYASSIQCPLGTVIGCTGAASSVPQDGSYRLLPGVLHAYTISESELGNYTAPVPEPSSWALMAGGLLALGGLARRRSQR
ncbi:esterase-like activity of phytase family protein [Paucibacter sp. DJ2R-2]|uniref:esterase-like activity of phytase family protein n=1 Tax=Paucibacter sp. DJ2R-2 TaxID=2893558 RepID=UPI0021E449C2|nr:esterase-like activity of phytase family protein [Paucibacter sp. DJ2R-2]MCV2420064.1 esterase-like activity of phytase family protein [Paucibacter sp. DJ4R-1]MCV2437009.1 esterase-like activity of phytase family protein [Paucibacter sp. DJ2R-2]